MRYTITIIMSIIIGAVAVICYMPQNEAKTVIKDHIVTVIKHIKSPDGTETTTETRTEDKTKKVTVPKERPWHISVGQTITDISKPIYKIEVSRDILGPISIGIYGTSDKSAGVSLGISF